MTEITPVTALLLGGAVMMSVYIGSWVITWLDRGKE